MSLLWFRAMDNTLPLSAYGYISSKSALDPASRDCFHRFVDAYINTDHRCALVPAFGDMHTNALMRLWRDGAKLQSYYQPEDPSEDDRAELWRRFEMSVSSSPREWSGWLRYEWDPNVALVSKTHYKDWRERLMRVGDLVRASTSRLSLHNSSRLAEFSEALSEELRMSHIDPEYLDESRKRSIDLGPLGLAYCFDTFERGRAFALLAQDMMLAFHPLRDAAVIHSEADAREVEGPMQIRWGNIVDACMKEKVFSSDPELLSDILRGFHTSVKSSGAYEEITLKLGSETDSTRRDALARDAVLLCFSEQRIVPPLRGSTGRSLVESLSSLGRLIPGQYWLQRLLVEAVSQVTKLGILSQARFEYRLRSRRDRFWKLYRIPGLE